MMVVVAMVVMNVVVVVGKDGCTSMLGSPEERT